MADTNLTSDLLVPKGSLLLVTGTTGQVGSNIVKEALDLGYRVRGTVRTTAAAEKLESLFNSKDFETMIVSDMTATGAYDRAVEGASAIIHLAGVTTLDPDPNTVIRDTVAGATGMFVSALKEPSVKRLVYTSTQPGQLPTLEPTRITAETWNWEAVGAAWSPPPHGPEQAFHVYLASKMVAEKAVWHLAASRAPRFSVNTVLPYRNFGRVVASPGGPGQYAIDAVRKGELPTYQPPGWMIDVVDDARIHVAAAIDGTVTGRRILAYGHVFHWNDFRDAVLKVRPGAALPGPYPDQVHDKSDPDNELGRRLLKKWWGQEDYKSLDESIAENLSGY